MADIQRRIENIFEIQLNLMKSYFDELTEMKETRQRLAGLEHEARQPRLAMEADVIPDTKTRKRTEDAAADQAKHGDKSSSAQVDHDSMCPTSFGDESTKPPALSWTDDALAHPWRCSH